MRDLDKMITKETKGCSTCPLASFHVQPHNGYEYWVCGLEKGDEPGDMPDRAPDWCPLRKGPALLMLEDK